jgi:radical SAM protein with 4Fe4S-binding SPASM domain
MSLSTDLDQVALSQGILLRATIELLSTCNLHCSHCYVSASRRSSLPFRRVIAILDELAAQGCMFVTFTGGEIGARRDLAAILREAKARRYCVTLLSSGTLWREKAWETIARLGIDRVRLSLYSTDPAKHDALTGVPGSHSATVATLDGLMARAVDVELACAITSVNADGVPELFDLAQNRGLRLGLDPTITWSDLGDPAPARMRANEEQLRAVARAPKLRQVLQGRPRIRRDPDHRPCRVGDVSAFVRANGDILPCAVWPDVAGNVHDGRIVDVFRNSSVFRNARSIRNRDLVGCLHCRVATRCHVCPAMNLTENRSLAIPSATSCGLARSGLGALHFLSLPNAPTSFKKSHTVHMRPRVGRSGKKLRPKEL